MILLNKDSETTEYAKKGGFCHIRMQVHPRDKEGGGFGEWEQTPRIQKGRTASAGPAVCHAATPLWQFAEIARKAHMPPRMHVLGIKRISAKYPKVLLWCITTCSSPLCWLMVPM